MRPQEPKGRLCQGCPRFELKRCVPSNAIDNATTHLLFVGEQPDERSAGANTPFQGHGGKIITTAITMLRRKDEFRFLNCRYTYAVQCGDDNEVSPNKKELAQCLPYLQSAVIATQPKVIVALGAIAAKQLGIKAKHKDARGKFIKQLNSGIPVLVTFSEKALLANPGLFETFKRDILNAFSKSIEGPTAIPPIEEISSKYSLPGTVEEVEAVCETIVQYSTVGEPDRWAISVDTETTTLYPEKDGAKIIAFCFGWGPGYATTILYEHPFAPPEYLAELDRIKAAVARVLGTRKPKILHNAKFDLKFLELKYKFNVQNVAWDTLLGEHLLDEDKKGNYGLKALTAGWLPKYCGYEDKLYDILTLHEGVSQVQAADKEIEDLEDIIQIDHPEFLQALRDYREKLVVYETLSTKYDKEAKAYFLAQEDYLFCKAYLAGLQAAWKASVSDWPKGKRGKPKKPVKWFTKPVKPSAPKAPEKPKDPRSKKEQQISKDAGFENVPLHDLQVYGAVDADVTRQLASLQNKRIKKENSRVAALMKTHAIPASRVLGKMEFEGTRVDLSYIEDLDSGLRKIVNSTEAELYDMAGRVTPAGTPLNINGSATLANILYTWGWTHPDGTQMAPYKIVERTAKGQPSTSEKILRPFVEYEDEGKTVPTKDSYFVERLLRYRKASKALNTFLANVRALSKRDGYLHTQFHLNGTGTGRLSSSDMNMQNIPKMLAGWNIKKLFIPDDDSYVIVNVDYKGAEVRVFTAYAKDESLIKALNEGFEMHSFFAHKVFGKPYEKYAFRDDPTVVPNENERKLLDKERSLIKRVVFGILYGAGPLKISETIGVSLEKAKELIALLYKMFPAIEQYAIEVEKEVITNHWVETHFGRRRRFPLAGIKRHRNRAVRQARNFKIQSTSSDIVISQLIALDGPLRNDMGGRLLLTVHDSMVMQYPKRYLSQLKEFVKHYAEDEVREKYPWLPVPFKVDIEAGPSYGECQAIDNYLANYKFAPKEEGVIEEHELLNELREAPFIAT